MNKLRLFIRSIGYSVRLVYRSSGLAILVYLLLHLIPPTLTLVNTFALKYILDTLTAPDPHLGTILLWVGLYVAALFLKQAVTSVSTLLHDSIFKKAEHLYECDLVQKLSELPLSVLDSSAGKDMVDDVYYTKYTAVYTTSRIIKMVTNFYTFAVAFAVLVRFHIWFSLLFLILAVPGMILHEVFDKKAEDLRRKTAPDVRKFSYYRWMLSDAWPAKDVRMYDLTEPIKARYDEEKSTYIAANKRLDRNKMLTHILAETLNSAGKLSFVVFVVLSAIEGKITVGDVALYTSLMQTACQFFRSFLYVAVIAYLRSTERMARLFEFLAIKTEQKQGTRPLDTFESLTFDNVTFKYPHTDKYVLSGVSFTLNRGDKLSIVGINGSGKSTIIKLMLGLYDIDGGQILINGHPMSDYDIRDVRRQFSALFQSFVKYPLTLRENVALSALDRAADDAQIEHVLTQSGVYEDLKPKLSNALDSYMTRKFDDNGTELSKGQWQKIALSRAYFKQAAVIIFDEPSAALDAEAEDRIFKNFEDISDGKTGIMISHRISGARLSSKIIVLDDGKITEQGTHDELVTRDGLYAKLYNLQREKYTMKEVE